LPVQVISNPFVFIERLWRSLKYELIYPGDFASGADLFTALERDFCFYNHQRPQQALAYRTPADLFPHRSIRKGHHHDGGRCPPNPPGFSALFFQNGWFLLFWFEELPYTGEA
jgi:hypothetical protein